MKTLWCRRPRNNKRTVVFYILHFRMALCIFKYGGEIMATPHFKSLAYQRIQEEVDQNNRIVCVVSALGGVTEILLQMVRTASNRQSCDDCIAHLITLHTDHCKTLFDGLGAYA
jgi:aspartokinase